MDFGLIFFFPFLGTRRTAHGAAWISAALAKCAVRARVLLGRLLIHALFYIFSRPRDTSQYCHPLNAVKPIKKSHSKIILLFV